MKHNHKSQKSINALKQAGLFPSEYSHHTYCCDSVYLSAQKATQTGNGRCVLNGMRPVGESATRIDLGDCLTENEVRVSPVWIENKPAILVITDQELDAWVDRLDTLTMRYAYTVLSKAIYFEAYLIGGERFFPIIFEMPTIMHDVMAFLTKLQKQPITDWIFVNPRSGRVYRNQFPHTDISREDLGNFLKLVLK